MAAPTGAGKTKLAATIAAGAVAKGNRMAFVVPAISLIDQTVEMFDAEGVDGIGVMQANHALTDWTKPVQVCSIQTIRSRGQYPDADIVVIDECHVLHKAHKDWMAHEDWARIPFIGLSATPWARGLGKQFDKLLIASTTKEMIRLGWLSPYRVFAPAKPDLSEIRKIADDFHQGDLSAAMNKPKLVGDVIDTWKRLWGKDKTVVFCVDLAHARSITDGFLDESIRFGYQDASTPTYERLELRRAFHAGEIKGVCSCETMIMGVDWDVRCLVWARPTMSEMLYVQGTGRGLRTAPGKDELLIIDHADNAMRLGFVDDIHYTELDDGKPKKKAPRKVPLPRMCKQCKALMPPATVICPECGHLAQRRNKVMFVNGELVQVDLAMVRPEAQASCFDEDELRTLYAMLKGYSEFKSYQRGWIAHKFKDRTGGWPPRAYESLAAVEPSGTVVRWIENEVRRWRRAHGAR
jgi:superfamily II DNA or RNA helicase